MNNVEQARQAVREYLSRDHGDFSEMPEEDVISAFHWLQEYRDNLAELITLSEQHRGAWLACLHLLEHCEPTQQGRMGVIPDEQTLDPQLRVDLQKWAFRALSGQIRVPVTRGAKTKPFRDLRIQVAVYRAMQFGLPAYSSDTNKKPAGKQLSACDLVAEAVSLSPDAIKTIWQNRPQG